MMSLRQSNWLIIISMIIGIGILCRLGYWQIERLAWKENLIETVEQRRAQPPLDIKAVEKIWNATKDVNFIPVKFSGTYDHSKEQFYFVTKDGVIGWHVYTPLLLDDGRVLIVNRGFIPDQLKDQMLRSDGLVTGKRNLIGLARNPLTEKPGKFVPDNDLSKNIYYWRSFKQMKRQMAFENKKFVPFFVDAGRHSHSGKWPQGGSTRVTFPNNHLQYVITWFGLAFSLLGVGSYFLYARNRKPK